MEKQKLFSTSGMNEQDILKSRAFLLAEKKPQETDNADFVKVLAFQLATEIYGIELRHIRIVHPFKELTFIPGVPEFISGIINMRGEIVSIVNLKNFFDLPEQIQTAQRQVIILCSSEMEMGIEIDQVLGVKHIRGTDIQPSLPTLNGIRAQYLKGVTGDGMVLLDGEKILTDNHMLIYLEDDN